MGHNPQGKKYDDIELILRDEKHIEMFLELADEHDSDFDTLEAYANGKEPFWVSWKKTNSLRLLKGFALTGT